MILKAPTIEDLLVQMDLSQKRIDNAKNFNSYILYGAGRQLNTVIKNLNSINKTVDFIVDSKKVGQNIEGFDIFSPKILTKNHCVIITTLAFFEEISNELQSKNITYASIFEIMDKWIYFDDKNKYSKEYVETNYTKVNSFLVDELSRYTFLSVLYLAFAGNYAYVNKLYNTTMNSFGGTNSYFHLPQFTQFSEGATIIDCGAYTGDTLSEFFKLPYAKNIGKYYAFEAMSYQFNKLENLANEITNKLYLNNNTIVPLKLGVGKENCTLKFDISGNPSANNIIKSNTANCIFEEATIVTIDSFISIDENIELIKMDIEGAEIDTLHGAKNIIISKKPKLAISIYHSRTDLFEIALLIKSWVPEYKMQLRHYTYLSADTVLYCY